MFDRGSVKTARCPECGGTVALDKGVKLGEFIECHECGTMLEVISLKPLEIDYALGYEDWEELEEDEEWDDEEWEEGWEEEEV
jgi:lysine biosynthesis protein LysW